MRILLIGSGGREHALAWKLVQEAQVWVAPGNPGIAEVAPCLPISTRDFDAIYRAAKEHQVDLVVCGPEDPLVSGLGDYLRDRCIPVYGPSRAGAQLEASKAFSKEMMVAAGVPTAAFGTFTDLDDALKFIGDQYRLGRQLVVKASGNAVGKGVVVANSQNEAEVATRSMLEGGAFGAAGETVVVEERLVGREFSLLTIVGDHNWISLPVAQDYKRALDNDQGPNTGGMGSYSPVSWVSTDMVERAEARIVAPIIAELRRRAIEFRGTLFSGVMVVDGEPICLEYNVRFGDPETQSVMGRLGSGFAQALFQAATGQFIEGPAVLDRSAVTVVVAAQNYPASGSKGESITLGPTSESKIYFHSGTARRELGLVTEGGRVVGATAFGRTVEEARTLAYDLAAAVQFTGARYRSDVAASE